MTTIPILFTFDQTLEMPAGVCFTSLLENAAKDTFYDIFILHGPNADFSNSKLIASAPSSFIMSPIASVSFPAVSEIQSDEDRMSRNYFAMLGLAAMVACPVFLGLIAVAKPLVPVLLTETWPVL